MLQKDALLNTYNDADRIIFADEFRHIKGIERRIKQ